jgi:predicted nucleic acid-binding protein
VARNVVLDSGPLGRIAHPRPHPDIAAWVRKLAGGGTRVIIPEIADYELRRNLLLEGLNESLRRLDELKRSLTYLPLSTKTMALAAEFWAEVRRRGKPTAPPEALDVDAILAAQAYGVRGVIATENVGHLSLFVEARHWKEIE